MSLCYGWHVIRFHEISLRSTQGSKIMIACSILNSVFFCGNCTHRREHMWISHREYNFDGKVVIVSKLILIYPIIIYFIIKLNLDVMHTWSTHLSKILFMFIFGGSFTEANTQLLHNVAMNFIPIVDWSQTTIFMAFKMWLRNGIDFGY